MIGPIKKSAYKTELHPSILHFFTPLKPTSTIVLVII